MVSPPQVLGGLHPNATWTPPPPAPWRGQHVRLPSSQGRHSAGRGKAGDWGGAGIPQGGAQLCPAHVTRKPKALATGARLGAAGHRQAPEQRAFEQRTRLPRALGPADPPGNAEAGSLCGLSGPTWRWNSWPWGPRLSVGSTGPRHRSTSWPGLGSPHALLRPCPGCPHPWLQWWCGLASTSPLGPPSAW